MNEHRICRECFYVEGPDLPAPPKRCLPGQNHRWLKAKVKPCPYMTFTETGRVTEPRRRRADIECENSGDHSHLYHHYGDPQRRHFQVKWR